jgi:glucokinase
MVPESWLGDRRCVMTLDAGGTSFRFRGMQGGAAATETLTEPSHADDLDRCLDTLASGFARVRALCPTPPVAISFAFPGPADYSRGIIGDLPNLPAFRGGVALGPMLEDRFGIPVFIRNDGDLFAYGEALAGFLPFVNDLLAQAGSPKRYRHLLGVTLGTGFGGGIAVAGAQGVTLYEGDNAGAGEMWLLRNKTRPAMNAEEGASARAVRRVYAERAGIAFEAAPEARAIFEVAGGVESGDRAAANEAFRRLGEVAGDAIAQAVSLLDALVVLGGGVSAAWPLFLPPLVAEMNGHSTGPSGERVARLTQAVFNLEDPTARAAFVRSDVREITVPGSGRRVRYDASRRIGVGLSRLGTTEAIGLGAYALAVGELTRAGESHANPNSRVRQ